MKFNGGWLFLCYGEEEGGCSLMPQDPYEHPIVTVDIVLLTISNERLTVALLPRTADPFKGEAALIGGYVHPEEDPDAEAAVRRILKTKTGLAGIFFEQLKTFAGRERDPRGWSVSISYFALVPEHVLKQGPMADLVLRSTADAGRLPFDHAEILKAAIERVRGKGAYSTIPARLLPETFTMSELQRTYETVMGERLDQSAFRRKVNELDLLVEVEGEKRQSERVRRPATLYRLKAPVSVFDRRL
jgi:8-oxo-dGTP diphosphatase